MGQLRGDCAFNRTVNLGSGHAEFCSEFCSQSRVGRCRAVFECQAKQDDQVLRS